MYQSLDSRIEIVYYESVDCNNKNKFFVQVADRNAYYCTIVASPLNLPSPPYRNVVTL